MIFSESCVWGMLFSSILPGLYEIFGGLRLGAFTYAPLRVQTLLPLRYFRVQAVDVEICSNAT